MVHDNDGNVKELLEAAADLMACEAALAEARLAANRASAERDEARKTFLKTIGSFGVGPGVGLDESLDRLADLFTAIAGGSHGRAP